MMIRRRLCSTQVDGKVRRPPGFQVGCVVLDLGWRCRSSRFLKLVGKTPVITSAPYLFAAAPIQTSRYNPTISSAVGTRGLFAGLPDASACSAINGIFPVHIASSIP